MKWMLLVSSILAFMAGVVGLYLVLTGSFPSLCVACPRPLLLPGFLLVLGETLVMVIVCLSSLVYAMARKEWAWAFYLAPLAMIEIFLLLCFVLFPPWDPESGRDFPALLLLLVPWTVPVVSIAYAARFKL